MKEIKVIDENTIYINFKGAKFLLSWKVDDEGYYVACAQGQNWYEEGRTQIGDDWREEAFDCLPSIIKRAFDFVKFI